MSIDLSLILPNKCRSLRDKEEAQACFYDTMDRIVSYFHGRKELISEIIAGEYEILLIEYPLRDYGLVAKEDGLFFLNLRTGKMLTDFPIDNCRADFNGAGIQLFKGKESAFF